MIRLTIFISCLLCSTNLYGAENYASKKADDTSNTPQYAVQHINKTPEDISLSVDKTPSPIKRQIEQRDTESQNKKENTSPDEGWWHRLKTDPVATFTAFLFFATLALYIATRQLVLGAEKTAAQELRAYVFPNIDKDMDRSGGWHRSVPIIVQNFGKTPAHDLRTSLYIGLFKYPLEKSVEQTFPHDQQLSTSSKIVLAPSGYVRQYAILPLELNNAEVEGILSRKYAIFVSSKVEYIDAFEKKHTTRFCVYSTGVDFRNGLLATYHEGNDAN